MPNRAKCLIKFFAKDGKFWFGDDTLKVTSLLLLHGPTRRHYRNSQRTELYITGQANEQLTTAIMEAFPGVRWEVVTDIDVIKKLVPAEFQFVK